MIDPKTQVLFMGAGTGSSPVFYYRCMLPATILGASYASFVGDWPKVRWTTGLVHPRDGGPPTSLVPALENYDIIVMQQPHTAGWLDLIKALRARGKIVLFECDDYLHGIQEKKDHDFREYFSPKYLARYERCMRAADGMIVSTDFIAEKYARYNPNIHVCYNGIDLPRYDLTRPSRKTVNIGWAGATGHVEGMRPWLQTVANVMTHYPETTFVTIGQNFADAFAAGFPGRSLSIPFCAIEQYPGAMSMFDIALAPAGKGSWYRGKSDLRFLEAGALGIPIIADPLVYPKIEHGVTGFHARSPLELELHLQVLLTDKDLRIKVGDAAREYVRNNRAINHAAHQWQVVFDKVAG